MLHSSTLGRMQHINAGKGDITSPPFMPLIPFRRSCLGAACTMQVRTAHLPGAYSMVCCGIMALGMGETSTWPLTPLMCSRASLLASQQILCSCCSPPSFLAPPLTKRPMRPPCESCPSHASSLSAVDQAVSLSQHCSSCTTSNGLILWKQVVTTVLLDTAAYRAPPLAAMRWPSLSYNQLVGCTAFARESAHRCRASALR